MHRPNDLRELKKQLALIEERRRTALAPARGESASGEPAASTASSAEQDQEAATFALSCVIDYLDKVGADAAMLRRLLDIVSDWPRSASWSTTEWDSSARMNDSLEGTIAAIVHLRSLSAGTSARAAAEWVASNLSAQLSEMSSGAGEREHLSGRNAYAWYARWSGKDVPAGHGRTAYELMMRAGLRTNRRHGRAIETIPSAEILRGVLLGIAVSKGNLIVHR